MHRALITLSALLLSGLAFAQDVRPPAVIEAEIDGHIRSMRESLADIRALTEAAHTRAVQQQIRRKTQRIDDHIIRVEVLTDELLRASTLPPPDVVVIPPPVIVEEIPPPPPIGPIPYSPGDFQRVLAAVRGETFSDAKLQRLVAEHPAGFPVLVQEPLDRPMQRLVAGARSLESFRELGGGEVSDRLEHLDRARVESATRAVGGRRRHEKAANLTEARCTEHCHAWERVR